ncbi:hypothetical protein [Shewanella sp. 125m-1]
MNTVTELFTAANHQQGKGLSTAKPVSSLVPVSLQTPQPGLGPQLGTSHQSGLSVMLAGQSFSLKPTQETQLPRLNQYSNFMLNIVQINGTIKQSILLALGQTLRLPLPQALLTMISNANGQEKKLQLLAKRKDGYQLPNAEIHDCELIFDKGPRIELASLGSLSCGHYVASIKSTNDQLFLQLVPIKLQTEVNLIPEQASDEKQNEIASQPIVEKPDSKSAQKADMNFQYRKLFKALESIEVKLADSDVTGLNKTEITDKTAQASTQISNATTREGFLAGALIKAGGLPKLAAATLKTKQSLASVLLKSLPMMMPETLTELSQPQRLKLITAQLFSPSVSPNEWLNTSLSSHFSTMGLLLQLLLARASSQSISPELMQKLAKLQSHLALPEAILKLLEAALVNESLANIFNNLSLYQQASTKTEVATHYYFALPYSINHYQEQLEVHVQKENSTKQNVPDKDSANKHSCTWKLQLKFNLASGPLLISAQAAQANRNHEKPINGSLKLNFCSSSDTLIAKIKLLTPALTHKIEAVGFSQVSVTTKQENVPASILPGEHYLVKVHV